MRYCALAGIGNLSAVEVPTGEHFKYHLNHSRIFHADLVHELIVRPEHGRRSELNGQDVLAHVQRGRDGQHVAKETVAVAELESASDVVDTTGGRGTDSAGELVGDFVNQVHLRRGDLGDALALDDRHGSDDWARAVFHFAVLQHHVEMGNLGLTRTNCE